MGETNVQNNAICKREAIAAKRFRFSTFHSSTAPVAIKKTDTELAFSSIFIEFNEPAGRRAAVYRTA